MVDWVFLASGVPVILVQVARSGWAGAVRDSITVMLAALVCKGLSPLLGLPDGSRSANALLAVAAAIMVYALYLFWRRGQPPAP